ncbi:hypothetical protein NF212_18345 [Parasalinivibrio latis]|uniref:hypothetical protein n=1 Tax=Parasalinivibrio latis TaxID=2952610 RepID=UPI0030E53908
MVASKQKATSLSELGSDSLGELGLVLSDVERLLFQAFSPYKVIFSKLGFSEGFNCHFHAVPVGTDMLDEVKKQSNLADNPNGLDVFYHINKHYCDTRSGDQLDRSIHEAIANLKHIQTACRVRR